MVRNYHSNQWDQYAHLYKTAETDTFQREKCVSVSAQKYWISERNQGILYCLRLSNKAVS